MKYVSLKMKTRSGQSTPSDYSDIFLLDHTERGIRIRDLPPQEVIDEGSVGSILWDNYILPEADIREDVNGAGTEAWNSVWEGAE